MNTPRWFPLGAIALALFAAAASRAAAADPFVGRWALTLPTAAGWLEVKPAGAGYEGSLLWGGGSVVPAKNVSIADGVLTVTHVREPGGAGKGKKAKAGGPLTEGVVDANACTVVCPWHYGKFDLRTGAAIDGIVRQAVETYQVEVSDGTVFVGRSGNHR